MTEKMDDLTLAQEMEDFVKLRLIDWMLKNPAPNVHIEPRPDEPKAEFAKLQTGFMVFEPTHNDCVDLHISISGQPAIKMQLHLGDFSVWLEAALEVQSSLQAVATWESRNSNAANNRHKWSSRRGQFISDTRLEFERQKCEE